MHELQLNDVNSSSEVEHAKKDISKPERVRPSETDRAKLQPETSEKSKPRESSPDNAENKSHVIDEAKSDVDASKADGSRGDKLEAPKGNEAKEQHGNSVEEKPDDARSKLPSESNRQTITVEKQPADSESKGVNERLNSDGEAKTNDTRVKLPDEGSKDISDTDKNLIQKSDLARTPSSNGDWSGERGNSKWQPKEDYVPPEKSPEGKKPYSNPDNETWGGILEKYGIDGIPFKDGYPDFGEISKGNVEIEGFETGGVEAKNRNFAKADVELAEQKGCSPDEVEKWESSLQSVG